jgi:hypothetical protein
MRARIKGGVENVSRSIDVNYGSVSAIHAARDKKNRNNDRVKISNKL